MNTKLHLISALAASLTLHGVAMPTEAEVVKAVPKVERMLASEKVALESGKMTRAEVAAAAMKLAADADDEAAKLLLMKGAFILQVKDGDLEKAVKTMNALETAIADMPPQVVTNIIETALLGLPNKTANGTRLYQLLDATNVAEKSTVADGENLKAVVDGYTWSYRVKNGEAEIAAEKDGKPCCAVSPKPIGHVAIPLMLGGAKVTSIGQEAFRECQGLVAVTIPPSVTNIGDVAFYSCDIKSVNIPASVTSIGREAFRWCRALESVTIPSNLKILEQGVFASTGLTSVTIPTNVTSIGRGAVAGCVGLTAMTIPDSVTNIGIDAFRGSGRVKSVTIPSSVRSISDHAFAVCGELTTVTMRGERPTAPNNIFQDCAKLMSIHVPANAKSWVGMTEWQGIPLVFDGADGIKDSSPAVRAAVESILKGMIKVPGRDYWLSATELTQEQWEPIMEYNLSEHKGAKLPVECVSPDDCDVFLEKLNQTKEVQASQFDFALPSRDEWQYAAQAGSGANCSWIKPGVVGNVLDMAWYKDNGSNQTHAVATKAANAFGLYDMLGNVWEWMLERDDEGRRYRYGGSFYEAAGECSVSRWISTPRSRRYNHCGLRLAAHKKALPRRPLLGGLLRRPGSSNNGQQGGSLRARRLQRQQEAQKAIHKEKVDGYTWSFRVNNGEATIAASGRGCAISPMPIGNLVIPSTLGGVKVTGIGQEAFIGCSGLKSLEIPDSVTSIGRDSFQGCSGLTALSIPSSVTEIGIGAFIGCSGLTSVTISPNLVRIGYAAFSECDGLKQINVDAGNPSYASIDGVLYTKNGKTLVQCPGGADSVVLPSGLENIYCHSLRGCRKLKSLTVPPSVTTIGVWAFARCDGLESITLPQGVTTIHDDAFRECGSLKSLSLPDSVTDIGGAAFRLCTNLTFVTIPANVTRIGVAAFTECSALKRIDVAADNPEYVSIDGVLYTKDLKEVVLCPGAATSVTVLEGVTNIKGSAFRRCGRLALRPLPQSLRCIGDCAFQDCTNLPSMMIPPHVGDIGGCAFQGCSAMTEVMIPESVTNIARVAFLGCSSLTSVTIPSNVRSIGDWAFKGCNGLTSVKISQGLATLGPHVFHGCSKLESVMIPSNVVDIAWCAFYGCGGLKAVTISPCVTNIGGWAFGRCGGLTSVTIPEHVTNIGGNAFRECANLTSVTMCGECPTVPNNVFGGCAKLKSIHVPANAKSWAGMKEWQGIPLVFEGQ